MLKYGEQPIFRVHFQDFPFVLRARSAADFVTRGVKALRRLIHDYLVRQRAFERRVLGAPPDPLVLPSVYAELKDGRPVVYVDGRPLEVEILAPDHFSPAARYRKATAAGGAAAQLARELEELLEQGHPRVRRSKRSGLPIVTDAEGQPLRMEREGAVLRLDRYARTRTLVLADNGAEPWDSEGYLPVWDPPAARAILAELHEEVPA